MKAWLHFYQDDLVNAIKSGSWPAVDALLTQTVGDRGRTPAARRAHVLSWRVPHTGASLLHLAILYDRFHEVAVPLIREFGEELVGMSYAKPAEKDKRQWYVPKFEGETVLHMVIAKHAFLRAADGAVSEDEVLKQLKLLLDNAPRGLVEQHTSGTFFSMALEGGSDKPAPKGTAWYGETPLSFAVCLNMPRTVKFLVEYAGADLTRGDSLNKWTPMHMAVMHDRAEMLLVLEGLWEQVRAKCKGKEGEEVPLIPGAKRGMRLDRCAVVVKGDPLPEALMQLQDNQHRTPLILAASYSKVELFQKLWQSHSRAEWVFASQSCRFYPLDDIEALESSGEGGHGSGGAGGGDASSSTTAEEYGTFFGTSGTKGLLAKARRAALFMLRRGNQVKQTAFELITQDDDEAGKIMGAGPFRELLKQKWELYAGFIFWGRCVFFCFYLAVLFGLLFDARGPGALRVRLDGQLSDTFGCAGWLLTLAGGGAKLWMTVVDFRATAGCARFWRARGSTGLERWVSVLYLLALAYLCAWHWRYLPCSEVLDWGAEVLHTLLPFLTGVYGVWFLLGCASTAKFTLLVWKMLFNDFRRFLPASVAMLAPFVLFFVLRVPGLQKTLWTFLPSLMGTFLKAEAPEEGRGEGELVSLAFQIGGLMLTNTLIAMMSTTCEGKHVCCFLPTTYHHPGTPRRLTYPHALPPNPPPP